MKKKKILAKWADLALRADFDCDQDVIDFAKWIIKTNTPKVKVTVFTDESDVLRPVESDDFTWSETHESWILARNSYWKKIKHVTKG